MSAHHPDELLLMNYAAGNVAVAQAIAVTVHLCFCHDCRSQLKKLNHLGGLMLESITPATYDEQACEELLHYFESHNDKVAATSHKQNNGSLSTKTEHWLKPLQAYLPNSLADIVWKRQTSTISKYDLTHLVNAPGFQVALQKISAGAKVPVHTHRGFEYTVILEGGFSDELGVYHAGDFIERNASHKHTPTALQNEDCICLTVLNAPLKFTGWQRIFNPFMAGCKTLANKKPAL